MSNVIHGHARKSQFSPTYNSWIAMRGRCENPKVHGYFKYGAKGITVCDRWKIFENFLEDMGQRPLGKTLDRLISSEGYYPGNCVWATPTEQNLHQPIRSDNTSGFKGVGWKKQIKRWVARGHLFGKEYFLYCGESFEDACAARKDWEMVDRPLLLEMRDA